jgi:hypothetical protein
MKKLIKIFLWGSYDMFSNGICNYKEKEDFMVLYLEKGEDFKHRTQTLLRGIKYIPNMDEIPGYRSMPKYFKKEKPDILAVVSGHQSVDTIQEFNKTKLFCEEHGAELIVIKTFLEKNKSMSFV